MHPLFSNMNSFVQTGSISRAFVALIIVGSRNNDDLMAFKNISQRFQHNSVLRSTFKPSPECIARLREHYSNNGIDPNSDSFGVIGVMYHSYMQRHCKTGILYRIGNDVQLGITETGHRGESCLDASKRGSIEEALVELSNDPTLLRSFEVSKRDMKCRHQTYTYRIEDGNYKSIYRSNVHVDSSNDDKTIKGQLFICGHRDDIIPIIKMFEPTVPGVHFKVDRQGCLINDPTSHDPIQKLVFIPFSRINEFMS